MNMASSWLRKLAFLVSEKIDFVIVVFIIVEAASSLFFAFCSLV